MNQATDPFNVCKYTSYLSFGGSHCHSFACSIQSSQRMWLLNFALVAHNSPFHFGINAFDPTLDPSQAISMPFAQCQQMNSSFTNARFSSFTGHCFKGERTPSFLLLDFPILTQRPIITILARCSTPHTWWASPPSLASQPQLLVGPPPPAADPMASSATRPPPSRSACPTNPEHCKSSISAPSPKVPTAM